MNLVKKRSTSIFSMHEFWRTIKSSWLLTADRQKSADCRQVFECKTHKLSSMRINLDWKLKSSKKSLAQRSSNFLIFLFRSFQIYLGMRIAAWPCVDVWRKDQLNRTTKKTTEKDFSGKSGWSVLTFTEVCWIFFFRYSFESKCIVIKN